MRRRLGWKLDASSDEMYGSSLRRAFVAGQPPLSEPEVSVGRNSDVPDQPGAEIIFMDDRREAALRGRALDLALTLSAVPDQEWQDAFFAPDPARLYLSAATALQRPTIVDSRLHWSVDPAELERAWWYLNRCIKRANDATLPARRSVPDRWR